MRTTVVNVARDHYDAYVGRPSKWGNPFVIGRDGTREEVVGKYRRFVGARPDLQYAVFAELRGKRLGCYCKPLACHADVLAEWADRPRTLAVGERNNCRPPVAYRDDFGDPAKMFAVRLKLGFYSRGPRRAFLSGLGVEWDDGVNLLLPSPLPGEWDAAEARRVADALSQLVERYDAVLAFGRRACDALGIEYAPCQLRGKYLPLPHPSGRCRLWNDPATHDAVRKAMKNLKRHFTTLLVGRPPRAGGRLESSGRTDE